MFFQVIFPNKMNDKMLAENMLLTSEAYLLLLFVGYKGKFGNLELTISSTLVP